jgi:uncharacterized membrane protein
MDGFIFALLFAIGIFGVAIALFVKWLNKSSAQKVQELASKVSELEARIWHLESKPPSSKTSATVIQASTPIPAPVVSSEPVFEKTVSKPFASPSFEPPAALRSAPDFVKTKSIPSASPLIANAKAWLFGGNTVARFGLLILFLGLSFLAKYAADNSLFPIEARLAVIGIVAFGLLVVGWRLRVSKPAYGLLLQGGAVAVLYLEIFAGYKFYGLMPGLVTFGLMMLVCAFATFLALRQNTLVLALVASIGGFLTPILTSSGGGNFAGLFSIYAILNLGIFAIARYKSWRLLYLVGFVLTFGVATLWALEKYVASDFPVAIGFIVFFIALYSLIPVLEAKRAVPNIKHYVDGTLVFGTPTVGFGLLVKLVAHWEYGAAIAALGLGAWYLVVASLGLKKLAADDSAALQGLKSAFVSYVALGAGFASLAIPLALDPRLAGIAWAVEGAALVWLGLRNSQALTRLSGVLLQVLGLGIYLTKGLDATQGQPFLNSIWLGATMLAIAMYASSWLYRKGFVKQQSIGDTPTNRFSRWWQRIEPILSSTLLVVATVLVVMSTSIDLESLTESRFDFSALLAFWSLLALAYAWIGKRVRWPLLGSLARLLLPMQVFLMLLQWFGFNASFEHWRWVVWPLSLLVMYFALRWRQAPEPANRTARWVAGVYLWLGVLLVAQFIQWLLRMYVKDESWAIAGVGVWLAGAMLIVLRMLGGASANAKPATRSYIYRGIAPRGVAWLLGMWFVFACISDYGGVAIRPFIPFLNPIDLSATFALMSLFAFSRSPSFVELNVEQKYSQLALAGAAFLLLNTVLMRALSHYLSLDYSAAAMMDSATAQSAFSLLWALLATLIMFFASRKFLRSAWIVGASLLGVVVVKLFLVDLSAISALTRIVSFVGVGLLMLLIGYLSPLPPAASSATNKANGESNPNSEPL